MRPVLFFIIKTFWHFIYISKLCKWHRRHQRSVDTNENMEQVRHITPGEPTPRERYLDARVTELLHAQETLREELFFARADLKSASEERERLARAMEEERKKNVLRDERIQALRDELERQKADFDRLKADFERQGQVERHTLSEWLDLVERLPSSQNAEAVLLVNTLLLIYRHPTDEEFARLQHLGHKEPEPALAFAAPVYDVSGNAHVSIGMPSASKES